MKEFTDEEIDIAYEEARDEELIEELKMKDLGFNPSQE